MFLKIYNLYVLNNILLLDFPYFTVKACKKDEIISKPFMEIVNLLSPESPEDSEMNVCYV